MKKEAYVLAKCVDCGKTEKIYAGEVAKGEQPMCLHCGMPMIAEEVSNK